MERLDFILPDFVRTSWTGDQARSIWEPRIQAISQAWQDIEWLAVVAGLRRGSVTMVSPLDLVDRAGRWVEHELNILPIALQGASNYSYSSASQPFEWGKPFQFRLVLGSPANTAAFKRIWDAGDDQAIGEMLGYPACCQEFFRQVWVDQGMIDTTWPMAQGVNPPSNGARLVKVEGPPEANILWRWMGIRAVPHLPCRFDCPATVQFGRQLIDLGRQHGYNREMDWLLEILSWPVEWSALHGIAEVKTPILKVSARTDATAHKYTVQRQGDRYPTVGAQGLRFPYQQPAKPLITGSKGFQRGLESPIKLLDTNLPKSQPDQLESRPEPAGSVEQSPSWYVTDNGFNSLQAMDMAHRPIVELAVETLAGQAGKVLDLGCGNGALLKKIYEANSKIVAYGLEFEQRAGRIDHARLLSPDFADNFMSGNMFDSELPWPAGRRYALTLLMPGRLLEVDAGQAGWLRAKLQAHCDQLLIYAYGDWLVRYGTLANLARRAGLTPLTSEPTAAACLARIV